MSDDPTFFERGQHAPANGEAGAPEGGTPAGGTPAGPEPLPLPSSLSGEHIAPPAAPGEDLPAPAAAAPGRTSDVNETTSTSPVPTPTSPVPTPTSTVPPRPIAHKEYYSISEVCELVGLKPHVLRYWESQFPVLNPSKNRSGNRVYQRKEIKLVLLVQHLLYKEKYTIEGARQRLEQLRRGGELSQATSAALDSEMRALLRDELQQLLQVLAPGGRSA
jgi:DNA-binding transcriptional MerR regulator